MFRVFLGVFLVFLGCSWFSWSVPGFLGVFRVFGCSGMFRDVTVFRCSWKYYMPTLTATWEFGKVLLEVSITILVCFEVKTAPLICWSSRKIYLNSNAVVKHTTSGQQLHVLVNLLAKLLTPWKRVSMGLTVSRKTAKNLAVRRKNERILTVNRKKC